MLLCRFLFCVLTPFWLTSASPTSRGHWHSSPGLGYGRGSGHGPGTGARSPVVRLKNGTLLGHYSPQYDQDYFLGVPYALPPTGTNRFRVPQSINARYGTRDASHYSSACVGYGSDQWPYPISEDCLYLNVIRPSTRHHRERLPVAFWIHGGGYTEGSGIDQRYNLSFIVQNSVKIGRPIIGVSINYRLSGWGFLQAAELDQSGDTNLGLRDQRLALHWVQENIAAFGGDPSRVTIWGESAGASSVGFHLVAYGGRDDRLFRAAMMESGNPVPYFSLEEQEVGQGKFNNITASTGCGSSTDKLDCLRRVPFGQLNAALNTTDLSFAPYLDGDLLQQLPSLQLAAEKFVHVPILDGANSDEGASFSPMGVNTTADFTALLSGTPPSFIQQVLLAYPDLPSQGIPGSPPLGPLPPMFRYGAPLGAEFRRSAAYFGDQVFVANRRLTCQTWAAAGLKAFCYRFNAVPAGLVGMVPHFQEVAFVFYNLLGVGYNAPGVLPPFEGKDNSYKELSRLMASSWASFVHDLDPNSFRVGRKNGWFPGIDLWPEYSVADPQNFVFDANVTSHPEADTWRATGINLINENNAQVFNR